MDRAITRSGKTAALLTISVFTETKTGIFFFKRIIKWTLRLTCGETQDASEYEVCWGEGRRSEYTQATSHTLTYNGTRKYDDTSHNNAQYNFTAML